MVLNGKDVGSLHVNAVEEDLGDVTFSSERDSRVTVKVVRGGSDNVSR